MNNNYPIWWDRTVTIFNKYENPITNLITWTSYTIKNCFVKRANNQVTVGNAILQTDDDIIRIPESKKYKTYSDWVNIPNDEKSKYFTLHTNDIIIFGEVDEEIDEYTSGKRSTDLMAKYKNLEMCIQITHYQENIGRGRVLPHYYISGKI